MKIKDKVKKYFEQSNYMIDKQVLSFKIKCSEKYLLKVLKVLRDEKYILRIRTAKKYYYKKNG